MPLWCSNGMQYDLKAVFFGATFDLGCVWQHSNSSKPDLVANVNICDGGLQVSNDGINDGLQSAATIFFCLLTQFAFDLWQSAALASCRVTLHTLLG